VEKIQNAHLAKNNVSTRNHPAKSEENGEYPLVDGVLLREGNSRRWALLKA
jgi:hypothetical protein